MFSVFTSYIQSFGPSGEPDAARFEQLWQALRGVLRSEVKRRGLWESPPALLGVHGWCHWWPQGEEGHSDALDELTADCYTYIFVDRLRRLHAHLRHKPNIDGLIFRCVRNYLYDAQKRQDPLGFLLFSLLKTALEQLTEEGVLYPLAGSHRISNDTIFGWRRGAEPAQVELQDLGEIVRSWNDELLSDLVAGHGKGEDAVVARLRRRILSLDEHGVEVFRTGDIIEPFKADVRARWAALFEEERGESAIEDLEAVRLVRPDLSFEDRNSFDRLVACVTEGLCRFEARRQTRQYLATLWRFLQTFATETGLGAEMDADRMPSQRKLANHLDIPRDRIPELFNTLRQLVGECFQATPDKPAVNTGKGSHER